MCADFPPREPALNPPDGGRWTDERLDDLANTVWAMRDLPQRVAVLSGTHDSELRGLRDDISDCKTGIEKLHAIRSEERKERKADFYKMIGVTFAAATLVVGALGLFLA